MPASERKAAAAAPLFAALGDATRMELILRLTVGGPLSIKELSAGVAVSRQAVTKHLRVLAESGVIRGRRSGREHRYELDRQALAAAGALLEELGRAWDTRLERLKALVESSP